MTLTPEQLAEHNAGLGGSDSPRYANMDFDLWREKIGDAPPRERPRDARMEWGSRLEPVVRDWLAEKLRSEILPVKTQHHPSLPWMLGHLDGMVRAKDLDQNEFFEGVEVKCSDKLYAHEWGETGTDLVPIRHVLQVHHYMLVTSMPRFHIAVLLGGNTPRHYVIEYDHELGELLLARAKVFWQHVVTRTPPPAVTSSHVEYLYPHSQESIVKANETVLDAFNMLTQLRRQEARAKKSADEIEVKVKAFMGAAAILADPRGRKLATWREQQREYLNTNALTLAHPELAEQFRRTSQFRVFRLA